MNNKIKENQWYYYNLDLIEESLEKNKIPVVLIAGASSSGKSYYANKLLEFLVSKNLRPVLISTDNYNRGISEIIFNKVNENYFSNKLKNVEKMIKIIKKITKNIDFSEKFNKKSLLLIKDNIQDYIPKNDIDKFLLGLKTEFDKVNFDEKSVYNLLSLVEDVNQLINGKSILKRKYSKVISEQEKSEEIINNPEVILIEGIYALNDELLNNVKSTAIKTFIDCDNKSLFLRRTLRDKKITNCSSSFIIKNYLDFVVPAFFKNILPSSSNAYFIIENNMTFEELRSGDKISVQEKQELSNEKLKKIISKSQVIKLEYQKDTFFGDNKNILRLREISTDGKNYQLHSLIHKGYAKCRFDKKLIRPINILLDSKEINNAFSSEKEIIKAFSNININVSKTIIKQRYEINYQGNFYYLDKMNEKYILENDEELNKNNSNSIEKDFLD